jgi:DNA-binding transcriptional ArsR family regulator
MGIWKVPVDILAESRFAISTLAEVTGSLSTLRGARTPEQRAFRAAYGAAFNDWLAGRPVVSDLVRASFREIQAGRFGLVADFLGIPPPRVARASFESELDQLRSLTDNDVRADLIATTGEPLAPTLREPGVRDALVDLVVWLWTHTVESDWPRREQVLRADIVARTDQLARLGWGSVLRDLGRDHDWVGNGELRINRFDRPTVSLPAGSRLTFVPTSHSGSWAGWYRNSYALYYPVAGRLAAVGASQGAGLGPLIGESRAQLLRLLEGPRSTTHLVALSGQTLGAVGRHLKVLLGAGAVLRRRSGREVLYWRTPLGDSLVASDADPSRNPDQSRPHR